MRGIFTFSFLLVCSIVFSQQVTVYPTSASQTGTVAFTPTTNPALSTAVISSDNSRIQASLTQGSTTAILELSGFNFGQSIIPPTANIIDIDVIVEGFSTNNRAIGTLVQLTSNGSPIGVNGASTNTETFAGGGGNINNIPDQDKIYGGQDYVFGLEGQQLTGFYFNNNNIGVRLQFRNNHPNSSTTLAIDNIRIVVTYEPAETMPVEFISFHAKKADNGVQLTWKVGTEVDVDRYEVERSSNGSSFTKIGTVTATHSSSYSFTDLNPLAGTAYYRVRNVDRDGQFKYTTVAKYSNGKSEMQFKAFPTSTKGQVTFQHPAAVGRALISVHTLEGRSVRSVSPAQGSISTPVDLSTLPAGTYLLKYQSESGSSETFRVIKH